MNYNFYKKTIDTTKSVYYFINTDTKTSILKNFYIDKDEIEILQEIISGVTASKNLKKENPYEWANEDVYLTANENGVWLINLMARRGGETDRDKLNLILTHDEFITFMKDFKKFIEDNM
jgi:spore germination protein YaaH